MKFAKLLMLLGFMVVVSQQERFPYFSGHEEIIRTPWAYANGYPRSESLYSFLLAREFAERMRPAVAPSFSDWTDHSPIIIESSQSDSNTNSNIEARNRFGGMRPFKQSISSDDAAARFFLNYVTTAGSSNSFFNPFLKTIYYISTTTGTTTRTTSCIPAGSFTSASSTVACRKRREIFEILLGMHELSDEPVPKAIQEMSPSQVLPLEASAASLLDKRDLGDDAILIPTELASSKVEDDLAESGIVPDSGTSREKRFFIASSTITSYLFVTTTTTRTLSNIGSDLLCIPSQFFLC